MEDVLEEVVGDISDEYDQENKLYTKLNANTYIFDGKILLTDFIKIINAPAEILINKYDEVDTLAGLILEIKSDFPLLHEQITFNNWVFEIMEINARRISKIKITINETNEDKYNNYIDYHYITILYVQKQPNPSPVRLL